MLARYQMLRGARPPGDPLLDGIRQDTRKHTRHFLRPSKELVDRYLVMPRMRVWTPSSSNTWR